MLRPTSSGILVYDPPRDGMKKNAKQWCVLNVRDDFVKYYQSLFRMEKHINLKMPAWGAHISIVRGLKENITNPSAWKKYHGMKFEFEYDPEPRLFDDLKQDGQFYCFDVYCPKLMDIRAELGLSVHRSFHITIGRTYY